MRNRSGIALLALIVACACGCAVSPSAPPDFLPKASEVPMNVKGAWIEIDPIAKSRVKVNIDGELLAVENSNVYVLLGDAVRAVPIDSIKSARISYYASESGGVAGAVFLGTMSTLSNGILLIFTAPLWIIAGTATTAGRSRDPILDMRPDGWAEAVKYARFPQGLPPDFVPHAPVPVDVIEAPIATESPPEPAVVVAEKPRERSEWGFAAGLGTAQINDQSETALVLGFNVSRKWVSAGMRFSIGDRDPTEDSTFANADADGEVFDLGFLLGVRGTFRGVQAAVRAGPAAWGLNLGELEDVKPSFAAQGELFFYPGDTVGFGTIVTYNNNEFQDYYIVTLGIAIGPR